MPGTGPFRHYLLAVITTLALAPRAASCQEPQSRGAGIAGEHLARETGFSQEPQSRGADLARDTTPEILDSLSRQMLMLEKQLGEINRQLMEQHQKEELEELLKEADRLSMVEAGHRVDPSRKFFSGVRQQQGLNPNISFGMDFFGSLTNSEDAALTEPGELGYGSNGFYMREAQLSLVAPLDPFTRGKGFLSATPEGFSVDEVYMEWLNLPLHMNLKAGHFKPEFGFLNRYHDHALPQFDRPRVLLNFFGTEGLGGTGIATNFMLPAVIAHATSLDLSVIYGSNPQSFTPDSLPGVMFAGQFLNFYDLTSSSYLEIRLSGAGGKNDRPSGEMNTLVGSAGIAYKWSPVGREKYRTLEWKSEFLFGRRQHNEGTNRSKGFYSSIQNKLGARFWLGARVGYSEMPSEPRWNRWEYALTADFWQSEFVMTRLQYQYGTFNSAGMDAPGAGSAGDHFLTIQVVWAMGPHKHEAY